MRIGTRGSALALAQARSVCERLGPEAELVPITTSGDRPGADQNDKSRWVSELERALLERRVDVAVHSAKDVPAELAPGLALVAFPQRADARDAICGARSIDELKPGARVGTSSLRRRAQLAAIREDLQIAAVRGNVDTRLRKLAEGEFDALVLALAGLERLERTAEAGAPLDKLVPAAGQGALAIEARAGDGRFERLNDPRTAVCVGAERQLVHALGASCNTPVGAHAHLRNDGLHMEAWVGLPDGSAWLADAITTTDAENAGRMIAERLLAAGARDLL